MAIIYITGPTGSGKTTIKEALISAGYKAYDTDDEGMRSEQVVGSKSMLSIDPAVIAHIYKQSSGGITYVCGTTATDLQVASLFSKIIYLDIDEDDQKSRILNRTNSSYGKDEVQLQKALYWRPIQKEKYLNAKAIIVDASQDVDKVLKQILAISEIYKFQ